MNIIQSKVTIIRLKKYDIFDTRVGAGKLLQHKKNRTQQDLLMAVEYNKHLSTPHLFLIFYQNSTFSRSCDQFRDVYGITYFE